MARKRSTSKAESKKIERPDLAGLLEPHGLEEGQEVRVEGESETFVIRESATDGESVWVSNPNGWRAFMPEWLYPATRINNRGREVAVKSCPKEKRGLRRAWLSEHGVIVSSSLTTDSDAA